MQFPQAQCLLWTPCEPLNILISKHCCSSPVLLHLICVQLHFCHATTYTGNNNIPKSATKYFAHHITNILVCCCAATHSLLHYMLHHLTSAATFAPLRDTGALVLFMAPLICSDFSTHFAVYWTLTLPGSPLSVSVSFFYLLRFLICCLCLFLPQTKKQRKHCLPLPHCLCVFS